MICSFFLLAPGLVASAAEPVFWNRDGSGNFPAAQPPPAFDGETGTGIHWKTKLPNWSNSSPIVVETARGPRVILLAEPWDGYSPWLLCLDADTGKELWRRELDAVAQLPADQQVAARLARRMWDLARLRKRLTAELQSLYEQDKTGFEGQDVPPAAATIVEQAKAAGFEYRGIGQSAGGYANHFSIPMGGGIHKQDRQKLQTLGLVTSEWDYQGTWDGVAYPTPISDGHRIWTVTMHNLYSCHDMDGKVVWQIRFAPPKASDLTPEQREQLDKRWPGSWPGQGGFSTSPIMAEGKLVSCAGRMVRCLDAATGKLLWAQPMRGEIGQALGVPAFVMAGGERHVVDVGNEGGGTLESAIYRLRDGALVARLPGVTSSKGGVSGPVVWKDGILNRPSHEDAPLTFHRLVADGNKVALKPVWTLPRSGKREEAISLFRPAWRDGRLYNGGAVLNMIDGTWIAARRCPVNPGYYGQGCILIGPAVFHWNFYGDGKSSNKSFAPGHAQFVWTDSVTGKKLGEGRLPINPADGQSVEFKREQATLNHWRWLGAATPFPYRDRLYIRAYDFLWCIGTKPGH